MFVPIIFKCNNTYNNVIRNAIHLYNLTSKRVIIDHSVLMPNYNHLLVDLIRNFGHQ